MRRGGLVDLILGATVLIWALNVTVTRYVLTRGFKPLAYGATRYTAAALLAVGVAVALERSLAVGGRRTLMRDRPGGDMGVLFGDDRSPDAPLLALPDQRRRPLRDVRAVPWDQRAAAGRTGLRLAEALTWVCLAYAIVGPLFLTNLLWYTAIHRVGAARATLFANIQPFIAAVFAFVILSEHLHWLQVIGGLTILAGILLERRRPQPVVAVE
jgi:drug/metabolite transporter (DMT)-like permease